MAYGLEASSCNPLNELSWYSSACVFLYGWFSSMLVIDLDLKKKNLCIRDLLYKHKM